MACYDLTHTRDAPKVDEVRLPQFQRIPYRFMAPTVFLDRGVSLFLSDACS